MFCQVCWTGNRWQQRCFSVFLGEEFVPHARRSDKLERSVWCVSAVPMQMCLASMVYRQKQDYQDSPMMVPVQNAGNHREPKDRKPPSISRKSIRNRSWPQVPLALERCSSADGGNPEADLANHIVKTSENRRTKWPTEGLEHLGAFHSGVSQVSHWWNRSKRVNADTNNG